MSETERFLSALRFLTIVPAPPSDTAAQPDWLSRCLKYFPAIGIGVGIASATILLLAGEIWGQIIGALLAVATSIVLTGALHEDGLADTADAFGGGWTVEKRLAIMKDSRIGTYGALALGFSVVLRAATLAQLPPWTSLAALVAVHAAARITPAFVMARMAYVGDVTTMKVGYADVPVRSGELWLALITVGIAALPLFFISIASALAGLLFGAALAAALALWSRRLIGGYTGDVLGAIEQVFEIGFLLGVAAIIR
jgi:adenosylcobinamide-GDP ribazoletransferase